MSHSILVRWSTKEPWPTMAPFLRAYLHVEHYSSDPTGRSHLAVLGGRNAEAACKRIHELMDAAGKGVEVFVMGLNLDNYPWEYEC